MREVVVIKILVVLSLICNFVLAAYVMSIYNTQNEILTTKTVSREILDVWGLDEFRPITQLEVIPTEELK